MAAITGDGNAASEIILDAAASTFTPPNSGANISGFHILGVGAAVSGANVYQLSGAGAIIQDVTGIDILSSNVALGTSYTFLGAASGTTLAFDSGAQGVQPSLDPTVVYQTADTTGNTDSVAITIGSAKTTGFAAAHSLTLQDSLALGIATVSVASNAALNTDYNTINILNDANLQTLTVTGNASLEIAGPFTDNATTLTIANDRTASNILGFADSGMIAQNLTTLNLTGTNTTLSGGIVFLGVGADAGIATHVTSLTINTDQAAHNSGIDSLYDTAGNHHSILSNLTINNTGTGAFGIASVDGTSLANLTLNGDVAFDVYPDGTYAQASGVTTGITVNGATDNAEVIVGTAYNGQHGATADGGAAAGKTDTVTLGNGDDTVFDAGVGTVNITLGTGSDTVSVFTSTGESSKATVTLGAHALTVADSVGVGYAQTVDTVAGTFSGYATITGLNSGTALTGSDSITFAADSLATGAVHVLTAGEFTNQYGGGSTNLNNYLYSAIQVANAANAGAGHEVVSTSYNGSTYLVEYNGVNDTIVHLVGTTVTATSTATAGVLSLHG